MTIAKKSNHLKVRKRRLNFLKKKKAKKNRKMSMQCLRSKTATMRHLVWARTQTSKT